MFFRTNYKYKTTNTIDETTLPGTRLRYDETLIEKLKKDHRKILKMYLLCMRAYEKNQHEKLTKTLRQLKIKFTAHLLFENTRFYTYIKHYFKSDNQNAALIKRFSDDMDKHGKLVFKFLDKATQTDISFDEQFKEELEEIALLLREKFIASERELYFLYQSPKV